MRGKIINIILLLVSVFFALPVFASDTSGTINASANYAWGENMAWINFAPTTSGVYSGLAITDTAITGYAWSAIDGWINFGPTNSGQGVTNTSDGVLDGNAWSSNLGWISFAGVTINSSGKFTGTAGTEGSIPGRISFDCMQCNVTTDWRPLSARTVDVVISSNKSSGNIGNTGNTSGTTHQNIVQTFNDISLPIPTDTGLSDHVEAYNAPLVVLPNQTGLLVHTFETGVGVILQIPAHAYASGLTIEITKQNPAEENTSLFSFAYGGGVFNIVAKNSSGALVHSFLQPIKITLSIPVNLAGRTDIGVYWYDSVHKTWVAVPNVTYAGTTASFYVDHLTIFAVMQSGTKNETNTAISTSTPIKKLGLQQSKTKTHNIILFMLLVLLVCFLYFYKKSKCKNK